MMLSEIKTRVKRQFGDESGVQITDDDILRWVNDAQRKIVMNNEGLLEKSAVANSTINVQEYDLPVDLLLLRAIMYKGPGDSLYIKLKGYTFAEFNDYVDGWSGTTERGIPICYTVHASKIVAFPVPDHTQTAAFKVYYTRKPDLPVLYHDSVVNYCLQKAYELDEDFEASTAKSTEVVSDLSLLRGREDWKVQETYPLITILPEDM